MQKNNGFTLIELVIVIIVLGILSATAIPKFINISSDAKIATLDSIVGAFNSTNSIVMGKANIDGMNYSTEPQTIAGTDINVRYGAIQITASNLNEAMEISGINLADASTLKDAEAVYFYFGDEKPSAEIETDECHLYITKSALSQGTAIPSDDIFFELINHGC